MGQMLSLVAHLPQRTCQVETKENEQKWGGDMKRRIVSENSLTMQEAGGNHTEQ